MANKQQPGPGVAADNGADRRPVLNAPNGQAAQSPHTGPGHAAQVRQSGQPACVRAAQAGAQADQTAADAASQRLILFNDPQAHGAYAATLCLTCARQSVARRGAFSLALSGGSTPGLFFAALAGLPMPWAETHIFFADERLVGPEHPHSNYRLAREALLDRAPIPAANIHRIAGELPGPQAAASYEADIRRVFARHFATPQTALPALDCVHLGMGADGHTASLFPGEAALGETKRLAAQAFPAAANPGVGRVTMTLPLVNNARTVFFLAAGADKLHIARRIAAGLPGPALPAALVRPAEAPYWLLLTP